MTWRGFRSAVPNWLGATREQGGGDRGSHAEGGRFPASPRTGGVPGEVFVWQGARREHPGGM